MTEQRDRLADMLHAEFGLRSYEVGHCGVCTARADRLMESGVGFTGPDFVHKQSADPLSQADTTDWVAIEFGGWRWHLARKLVEHIRAEPLDPDRLAEAINAFVVELVGKGAPLLFQTDADEVRRFLLPLLTRSDAPA